MAGLARARPASTAREDHWPRRWAEAYVDFAAGEKRAWLAAQGVKWVPNVGWAERGGYGAIGHGNSVPRFHVTWGTGPGVVEPFERRVRAARVDLRFRHRVDALHGHRRRGRRRDAARSSRPTAARAASPATATPSAASSCAPAP